MTAPPFMSSGVSYALGRTVDIDAVRQLLVDNGLPAEGIEAHIEHFVLAWHDGKLIATAGLERCGRDGLLRSVCVDRRYQNRGVASWGWRIRNQSATGI